MSDVLGCPVNNYAVRHQSLLYGCLGGAVLGGATSLSICNVARVLDLHDGFSKRSGGGR